jgi:hypothetical protein
MDNGPIIIVMPNYCKRFNDIKNTYSGTKKNQNENWFPVNIYLSVYE